MSPRAATIPAVGLFLCAATVASAAVFAPLSRSADVYPKCYDITSKCEYYDKKADIGCCTKGAACVLYGEKGDGRYCIKHDDYYYYDEGRKEDYCYAKDGVKVVRGKKSGGDDYEYYSWKDEYKTKVVYPESYYKKLSKYYDDDKGKYWYAKGGDKKYVEEYYEEGDGKSCFYDEYGAKVYNFFYYAYDGKTYCYGKGGEKYYVAGDEAYYYEDEKKKDVKVYVKIDEIDGSYEADDGVYQYDHEGKKYYTVVYKKEYVEKHEYYSPVKKVTYKPKVVKKEDYIYTKKYEPKKYETSYDYNSYYYGKKKPGPIFPKPVVSPDAVAAVVAPRTNNAPASPIGGFNGFGGGALMGGAPGIAGTP